MDHDVDVALWQRGIQHEDDQELGPASSLFDASVMAFSSLLHILAADTTQFESESYQILRNEFRKFYMWNEGFSTRTGDLDRILSSSKNMQGTVLGLMAQWAKAASKIPEVFSEYNWSSAFTKVAELQMLADKVDQIAKAAMADLKSQCSVFDNLDTSNESDSGSDFEPSLSDYTLEDIIEDLSIYMESLTDLSPSLDHPAADHVFIEAPNNSLVDEFANVSEPARPFVSIIRDRFPSLETGIVKKLGEANWQRRERLRIKFASAPGIDETSSTEDDSSSLEVTVVNPRRHIVEDQRTFVSAVPTSISLTRTLQSTAIASDFSDPSIFDTMSISVPPVRKPRPPASVTSFATSIADGLDQGQRRIPNLPVEHEYGTPFQCQICGDVVTGVRNRADWKKHVYKDLEPYICLFTGCDLGLQTFQSRREWKNHEFQVHRVNIEWRCNLCKETFGTQEVFRGHIIGTHENEIATSQVQEIMSTSKRLVPCTTATQICPFCLTAPSETQAGFASHVGKHQQEIALAALPRLADGSDDESMEDIQSSDNDDDDDNLKAISSACIVCGKMDGVILRNQTVCLAPKCRKLFSQSNFGIRLFDIQQDPLSVELLLTTALKAAASGMLELLPGCPFKNPATILTLLGQIPSMASFAAIENVQEYVSALGPEIEKLLIWVCTGYRGCLTSAPELMKVPGMPPGTHQFVLANTTPEHESTFASHVSQIAPRTPRIVFHGTSADRLFAILHQGLQILTGTRLQRGDADWGPGIYVTDGPMAALAYACPAISTTWKSSHFLGSRILLGCELAGPTEKGSAIVVRNPAMLMVRYVFLIPENSIAPLAKYVVSTIALTCNSLRAGADLSASTIFIGESRFDLRDLDIDSDYIAAMPEDIREEAILHSLIRQKSKATTSRTALSEFHQLLLERLSANLIPEASPRAGQHQPLHDKETIDQTVATNSSVTGRVTLGEASTSTSSSWGPQNRLTFTIRDFEKALDKCVDLWKLLPREATSEPVFIGLDKELDRLRKISEDLAFNSSRLDRPNIEKSIKTFSGCRTQLIRLQKLLDSIVNSTIDDDKKFKRSNAILRQFFTRQPTSQKLDLSKAETIKMELHNMAEALRNDIILFRAGNTSGSPIDSVHLLPQESQLDIERVASKMTLAPPGTPHIAEASRGKSSLKSARSTISDDYDSFLNEKAEPKDTTTKDVDVTPPSKAMEVGDRELSSFAEYVPEEPSVPSDRASISESLKDLFGLNDNDQVDDTEALEEDDVAYPCKGCGDIVDEGKAFELAGNRWHVNCFRCNTCGTLLDSDANLLLLGDGSLICNNCTYSCSACGNKIEDLAILTGDQAFCATCFRCRNCKRKIENLRYARTSQGIFCMSCHESLMARRRRRGKKNKPMAAAASSPKDKSIPPLPLLPFGSQLGADVESGGMKIDAETEAENGSTSPELRQIPEK